MDATVQHLKELFEGSKVLEIRESNLRESICDFLIEKNNHRYSFTLCTTELGA